LGRILGREADRLAVAGYVLGFSVLTLALTLSGCTAEPDLNWQRIQAQGVLRVGMEANWVPFEYVDGSGQLTGFDVALARMLGERLGLQVQFYPNLSFDGLYDALTAERVDVVISAVVVDMDRSAKFAYSIPYFEAGQVLVVKKEDVDEMQDLAGRVLAVELGAAGDTLARRWARRLEGMTLYHTESARAALAAVAKGEADAALMDRASALMALKADPTRGLRLSGQPVTGERYAVVTLQEHRGLLGAVNDALDGMRQDGTLAQLERKWLGP
jgi:ABC-type amino acid transport substrate-binding protein